MPGAALDPDAPIAGPQKSHVMIVGHLAGEEVFGAERSLLELLAAVDRERYVLSCVLPGRSEEYVQAVARFTRNITVFPYGWWSRARPFDPEATARFEALIRSGRVDLVHVNTITLMDPLVAARRLGVPAVVHARELISHDKDLAAVLGDDPSAIVRSIRAASDFIIANSAATHRLYGTGDQELPALQLRRCRPLRSAQRSRARNPEGRHHQQQPPQEGDRAVRRPGDHGGSPPTRS